MRRLTKNNKSENRFTIEFLPFIDLNPTNESTIFTSLKFAIDQAEQFSQKPIITFDQPLWFKAMTHRQVSRVLLGML